MSDPTPTEVEIDALTARLLEPTATDGTHMDCYYGCSAASRGDAHVHRRVNGREWVFPILPDRDETPAGGGLGV